RSIVSARRFPGYHTSASDSIRMLAFRIQTTRGSGRRGPRALDIIPVMSSCITFGACILVISWVVLADQAHVPGANIQKHPAKATTGGSVSTEITYPKLVDIMASTGIRFEHVSSPEQRYIVESMSGGLALIDYDRDGWPDIYFTNAYTVDM